MEIVNQPFKQSLGFRLIEKIQSGHFSVFHFMVAYAKTSGVNRLLPYMRQFKENGGTIKAVVGIDQGIFQFCFVKVIPIYFCPDTFQRVNCEVMDFFL